MKLKFNWGTGILLFLLFFMTTMGFMVFTCTRNTEEMVTSDYYEKSLLYQQDIDEQDNVRQLHGRFSFSIAGKDLTIKFPEDFKSQLLHAQLFCYKPDQSSLDFKLDITSDSLQKSIHDNRFVHGLWRLGLFITVDNKKYQYRQDIQIP